MLSYSTATRENRYSARAGIYQRSSGATMIWFRHEKKESLGSSRGGCTCRTRVPIRTATAPVRRCCPRDLTLVLRFKSTRITEPHALGGHLEPDATQVELIDERSAHIPQQQPWAPAAPNQRHPNQRQTHPLALALIVIACNHVSIAHHLTQAV